MLKKIKNYIKYKLLSKNKQYLISLNRRLIFWNRFHQYILGINKGCPFPVHFTSYLEGHKNLILPKNANTILMNFAACGGCYYTIFEGTTLEIGEGTIWSFNVCIQTGDHSFIDRSKYNKESIKIGKNCWLGYGVTITKGVILGDNVSVGAGSVVTKSFPSNCVIAGVPAKIIKQL